VEQHTPKYTTALMSRQFRLMTNQGGCKVGVTSVIASASLRYGVLHETAKGGDTCTCDVPQVRCR
jgi:hypothetical protein